MSLHLPSVLSRVYYRYPAIFVDAVAEHEPGDRLVAFKNVTISEEFFQGHFPGYPVLPAVLMIEALTQAAGVLVLDRVDAPPTARAALRGVNNAKFRRQVVPGDRLRLEVTLGHVRSRLGKVKAVAYVDDQVVAEAELLLAIESGPAYIDPPAHVHSAARVGAGTSIGPNAVIGPDVSVGVNWLRERKHARLDGLLEDDAVEVLGAVPKRLDVWTAFARAVRGTQDFVRYLDPRFADARLLRARIYRKVLPAFMYWLDRYDTISDASRARMRGLL